jgi:hypothetical protein
MKEVVVIAEFAEILRRYMKKFSLEAIDIAYLAKSIKKTISSVLDNTGSIQLETAEAIAQSFGLRYFEFGNPDHPIPSFDSLPEKTKQRIAYRKAEGTPKETTYTQSDINHQINEAITIYKVGDEFLAEDIAISILEEYGETYSVSQIIDRFKKSFKEKIERTERKDTTREGRGPKPVFYKLVKK